MSALNLPAGLSWVKKWEDLRTEVERGYGTLSRWARELQVERARYDSGWIDLRASVREADAAAALTWQGLPTPRSSFLAPHMRRDQADTLIIEWQMPHGWVPSRGVTPHLHIEPVAVGAGLFALDVSYYWHVIGDAPGAIVSVRSDTPLTAADYTRHKIATLANPEAPSTAGASTFLHLIAARNTTRDTYEGNATSGTAAANVAIKSIDCHVFVDRAGTQDQGSSV